MPDLVEVLMVGCIFILALIVLLGTPIALIVLLFRFEDIRRLLQASRDGLLPSRWDQLNERLMRIQQGIVKLEERLREWKPGVVSEGLPGEPLGPERTGAPEQEVRLQEEVRGQEAPSEKREATGLGKTPQKGVPPEVIPEAAKVSGAGPWAPKPGAEGPPLPPSEEQPPGKPSTSPPFSIPSPLVGSGREPTGFEKAAEDILQKIWNWIMVGEEHRPKGLPLEYAIATTWLVRVGVLLVVLGMALFVKWSIDRKLLTEEARLAISVVTGIALLGLGTSLLGKKYHLLGLGLQGGGIALLYYSVFAAAYFYRLVDERMALGLVVFITAVAGTMAIRFHAVLLAILGILGAYGTPLFLRTISTQDPLLWPYLLVLGAGVLGVSYFKHWHLLNYLSFLGHYTVFFVQRQYYTSEHFWEFMPFLAASFILFSTVFILFNLVRRVRATLLETLALLANGGVFFGVGYELITEQFSKEWVALLTLSVTAFYLLHIYYLLKQKSEDQPLLMTFSGAALFFLTVTMPLVFSEKWVTLSWAVQAWAILWIAEKMRSPFLRQAAYLIYGIGIGRFCLVDLPENYPDLGVSLSVREYLYAGFPRMASLGMTVAAVAGALRWLKPSCLPSLSMQPPTPPSALILKNWGRLAGGLLGIGLLLGSPLFPWNALLTDPFLFSLAFLSLLALGVGAALLGKYQTTKNKAFWYGFLLLLGFFCLAQLILWPHWEWNVPYWPDRDFPDRFRLGMLHFLKLAVGLIFLYFAYGVFIEQIEQTESFAPARIFFGAMAMTLGFVFLTLELDGLLRSFRPEFREGGISILWALLALGLVLAGIWKTHAALRWLGLLLFAIVVGKVFLVDLDQLQEGYRILALLVLGILVLGGSFLYLKSRSLFLNLSASASPPETPSSQRSPRS